MTEWTSTREGLRAANQKAQEAYALARRVEERTRGLEAALHAAEAEIERLQALVDPPKPKRKAA